MYEILKRGNRMKIQRSLSTIFAIILLTSFAGCSVFPGSSQTTQIKASGTISTDTIQVAPEIGGKILEINVKKGDVVKSGDVLFRLDDALLQAQSAQADASVKAAQATLDVANQKLANTKLQYDATIQAARLQDKASRTTSWQATQSDKITLPNWYFDKSEQIAALNSQITEAQKALDVEQANLDKEIQSVSNSDFVKAEQTLVEAQQAFDIAQLTFDQANVAKVTENLKDAAQKNLDDAQSKLDSAQNSYNQMLSSDASTRVKEARARVAVAHERLNNTQDVLDQLLTGSDSLQVSVAQSAVDQAKAAVSQADAGLTQAQAALQLVKVQLNKMVVSASISGIVLSRPLNAGEMAAAGADVVEIGSLDEVTLTVYIPESQYGQIHLQQKAAVSTDSFPGKTFDGTVTYISNQAEFTPRNVQTTESRSTTVYKVEITLPNANHDLKPGMPADASF
jgi:HlyD family secretion protein